jgi:Divergent InlB B-repeat domain
MESNVVHGNGADVYAYQATNITGTTNITGSTTLAAVTGQQCNPNLAVLADNNGPLVGSARKVGLTKAALQTRAIPEGSCAINQGNNPLGLPYDQRGNGFVRQIGGAVDVGAYEAKLRPTVTVNKVIIGTPPDAGRFNLSVTGGNPAGGTNPANNVGNGGTTGAVSVDDGALITLSETAAAGSSLSNYYVTSQCAGDSGVVVGPSWSYQLGTTPSGEAPKNLTCTFFNRIKVPVNALLSGDGGGTVKSDLFGLSNSSQINCGATCSETFGAGIPITLTATPLPGSYFVGWSGGGCTGTGSCVVTPLAATTVTALFNLIPRLTVTRIGAGTGSVRSDIAGIDCGASCAANFTVGTTVTLTASPQPGSNFVGWSGGACTGLGPCTVQMNAGQNVTAQFDPVQVPTLGAFGRVALPLLLALAAFAFSNARRRA